MKRFIFGAALLLSVQSVSAATNLLVNGSFELPTGTSYVSLPGNSSAITGWTTILNGVEWYNAASNYPGGIAADGLMIVDLDNYTYTGGGIEQTFSTQTGQTYTLNFSLGTLANYGRDGTSHIDVTVAGATYGYNITNYTSAMLWTAYSLNFTATGTNTTLRFSTNENANTHFANLDAVSVTTAVPEPESNILMLSGLGFVGWAVRRRKDGQSA
jgi:hypothetical protein